MAISNLGVGSHSITATHSGDANLASTSSKALTESVARAGTDLVLESHASFKKKKLASLALTVEVEAMAPVRGVPSGMVRFMFKKKTLGMATLSGGRATIKVNSSGMLNHPITILYSGDMDFESATATPVVQA